MIDESFYLESRSPEHIVTDRRSEPANKKAEIRNQGQHKRRYIRVKDYIDPIICRIKHIEAIEFATVVFCFTAVLCFGWEAWRGLWFLSFGDEAEHLLGGRILNGGGRLYTDYIDSHGPTIFMLSQLYGALVGWTFPQGARLFMPLFALAAAITIACSPITGCRRTRLLSASCFLGGLAIWWLINGFYLVSFYPLGGFLCTVELALLAAPAWRGKPISLFAAAFGGAAPVLVDFTAYAYGPGTAMITLAGLWPALRTRNIPILGAFFAGVGITLLAILIWLGIYSSIGQFIKWHIIFNQTAYAPFISFSLTQAFSVWEPRIDPNFLSVTASHLILIFSLLIILLRCELRNIAPVLLTFVGVMLLNVRAAIGFKDGQTMIVALALFALSGTTLVVGTGDTAPFHKIRKERGWFQIAFYTVVLSGVGVAARYAVTSPFGWTHAQVSSQPHFLIYRPSEDLMSRKVRSLVPQDEAVLALPYFPEFYWMTDRMPPKKFYEYLPWDAVWAKKHARGFSRDLCASLDVDRPKLIYYHSGSEKLFSNTDYYNCIKNKLATYYVPVVGSGPLYLRRDNRDAATPVLSAPR